MSLTEFMADPSLGTPSWIEDDFDITSTLNSNPFKPAAPSPFGNSGNKSNLFERSHNGFGMREARNGDFHEPGAGTSWRSSAMPRGGQSHNYKNSNIIVFDNVPPFCTRQLIKELFESRYTKLEKCHVLLDPSDPTHKKKIAFVFLYTPQDMQKVLKWNGINIERSRIIIDSASSNEFQAILQFNHELNFDEDLEDKRIEDEQKEQREQRLKRQMSPTPITATNTQPSIPKVNPFGNAKPVVVPEIPIISESTKEIAKVLDQASKPSGEPHRVQPKVNPFGNAKPVLVPEIPIISENTAEIARKLELKVDSSNKSNRANSISKSPVRAPVHPKPNPFGNAKPVDTLAKQLEIEKKLTKAAVNETTFDMTLIHGKKNKEKAVAAAAATEKEKEKESDGKSHSPGSPVKILRRKDSVGSGAVDRRRDVEESKSPSSSSSSSSSGKGYKTTSGFERRIARDLSEEEYEQEMKKRNELRSHSAGKERGRGASRRMSAGRFGNKQRHNAPPGMAAHGGHGHGVSDNHDGTPQEPYTKSVEKGKDEEGEEGAGDEKPSDGFENYVQHEHNNEENVEPANLDAVSGAGERAASDAQNKEEGKPTSSEDHNLTKASEETPVGIEERGDAREAGAESPSSPSSPSTAAMSRGRGRGHGGRGGGPRRGRGGRGGRGDYSESGWGREGYGGYVRGRGRGSSNRSRGGYNGRGGYRNLVYHKPTTEAGAKEGSKEGADANTEPRTEASAAVPATAPAKTE